MYIMFIIMAIVIFRLIDDILYSYSGNNSKVYLKNRRSLANSATTIRPELKYAFV